MRKLKLLTFNSLHMKIIGFVLTLCGALGICFFNEEKHYTVRMILEFISYPAIPVFTFLLVEGFHHTASLKKYTLSLMAAAIVTEPFYDYACIGVWFDLDSSNGQNFLFALLLCMLVLVFLRNINPESKWRIFMICSLIPASVFWAFIFNARFSIMAVLMTSVFYLLRKKHLARDITAFVIGTVSNFTGGLSVLLIHNHNGQRGNYPKYLFYALYPAMWMVLALIKLMSA